MRTVFHEPLHSQIAGGRYYLGKIKIPARACISLAGVTAPEFL